MNHLCALQVGRLESIGQSTGVKAPSLASFLSQRANQVLGARQSSGTLQGQAVASEAAPVAAQESSPVNPQLARQMDQLQRLHSSISLPSNQGISVLV